jgi:hypothetical protein
VGTANLEVRREHVLDKRRVLEDLHRVASELEFLHNVCCLVELKHNASRCDAKGRRPIAHRLHGDAPRRRRRHGAVQGSDAVAVLWGVLERTVTSVAVVTRVEGNRLEPPPAD